VALCGDKKKKQLVPFMVTRELFYVADINIIKNNIHTHFTIQQKDFKSKVDNSK
jgi:hypothetical protein